ncbi:MAG: RelA/SpoT family protein [Candidatus Gracilibacteria bacterium]|nr:RelA/SpoT family protein [Candidatus Gracilibacteria bacterium]MDD3120140.1 RelA/SpoT family protein [Candidatus Gracilibacteria bacterium]MDD4530130.1 RelA/SpoT family protein [Candidatus Gracilibacteria bacterium]
MSININNILEYKYYEVDAEIEEIIGIVCNYMKNVDSGVINFEIRRAYTYARDAHEGQLRRSGEPYIIHPVRALKELILLKPDLITIQACLLHDVAEDTIKTIEDIGKVFGQEVAYIASGVEKLAQVKYRKKEKDDELEIMSLRKMFIAMGEDLRVIFVKLADRIHNMKTLDFHPVKEKRERIALETLNIYAPIADRLGISEFKDILENECFRILHPEEYYKIKIELDSIKSEQYLFSKKVKEVVSLIIPPHIKVYDIGYRVKTPYSIYKKLKRKGYEKVLDLHDLFAIRIIVDTIPHCYEVLGVVNSVWKPIPGRFKQYIAIPKENGYQSLHTTVVGFFNDIDRTSDFSKQPTEIQIRTMDMHIQAEIGVAAHFTYSEKGRSDISHNFWWVNELKDILEISKNADFMAEMKIGIFEDRIFVFTPRGDIKNLPRGATPIDFAYLVHSDIGNHIAIAKVNNRVVPLDYELRNGDNIEIIIDKNRSPNITWLSYAKTSKAKNHIQNFINQTNRGGLIEKGRFILNTYLQKNFSKQLDKEYTILNNVDGRLLDMKAKEDLLAQIGNLSLKPGILIKHHVHDPDLLKKFKKTEEEIEKAELEASKKISKKKGEADIEDRSVTIGGQKYIPFKIALCCLPKDGDKIVGCVTKTGIKIHKFDCSSLKKANFQRIINAYWGEDDVVKGVQLKVNMDLENKIGVLNKITGVFCDLNINIKEMVVKGAEDDRVSHCTFSLSAQEEDYYIYEKLIEKIKDNVDGYISSKLLEIT